MDFPKNIKGIDYNLIDEYSKTFINYIKIINTNNDKINMNDINGKIINTNKSNSDNDVIRLEPPYTIACSFVDSKCQKKAAFQKIINNKYYCWFHMHCEC